MKTTIPSSLFRPFYLFGALLATAVTAIAGPSVQSPDGQSTVSFDVKDGTLHYAVEHQGEALVAPSAVSIFPNQATTIESHQVKESDSTWEPVWGQFSEIRDHHNELRAELKIGGKPVTLLCRVFDDGMGIRYLLPSGSGSAQFVCEFKVTGSRGFYAPNGEKGVSGPIKSGGKKKGKGMQIPAVSEVPGGTSIAIFESDLYTATGFESMKLALGADGFVSTNPKKGGADLTPWRVILWGDSMGALLESTVTLNLAAPTKLTDTSWIKPGQGLWDWRIHGYDNGDFVYGIDTQSYLRLIDFAAAQNIEYLTVDDHWFTSAKNGTMEVAPEVDIKKVMSYAKEKGVMIKLYYDRKKGNFGDETLFSHYAGLGGKGMKYGFMGNKAWFTRGAIEAGAENRLVMNFHDGPCPMVGIERSLPNLITREYCHAQQDSRRAFTPETFLKMAMVNALTGPLDMANGNFGIRSINAGERQKGPKKQNSYISTVVSECARTLVIYTGLVTLPDAPEEYLKKEDLFQFLKHMPSTWDETVVPNSKIGEYITTARRSGDTWFVGSVNNQQERSLDIKLDFLTPGKSYQVVYYTDAPDSHGVKNPEAYEISKGTVKAGDTVTAKMAVGGGHAMMLKPVQ